MGREPHRRHLEADRLSRNDRDDVRIEPEVRTSEDPDDPRGGGGGSSQSQAKLVVDPDPNIMGVFLEVE